MKKSLLTLIFAIIISATFAQNKLQFLTFKADSFQWSFQIRHELIPIDTVYSSSENLAFQTIRYKYQQGKKVMQLKVTMFYNGKYWDFRSCEVKPYQNQFYINTGSWSVYPQNFQPNFFNADSLIYKPKQ